MDNMSVSPFKKLGNFAIKKYQKFVSSALADDRDYSCKYTPSCSHYGQDAIKEHGLVEGSKMAFMRMMRCHNTTEGGKDPVLPKGKTWDDYDEKPAHLSYKYEDSEKIFSYSSRKKAKKSSENGEIIVNPDTSVKRYIKDGLRTGFTLTSKIIGGVAGAGLFAAIGTPMGAYLGYKAGRDEIDQVNAGIAKKYSPESVYGFAKIENSLAKPSYKIHKFIEENVGSKTLANIVGTVVGGPVGLAMGLFKGIKTGFQTGAQYGRLFGTSFMAEALPEKEIISFPKPAQIEDMSDFFKDKPSFDVGDSRITPVMSKDVVPSTMTFIESAKESIDVNIYSLKTDVMKDLLLKKAQEGVKVRVVTNLGGLTEEMKEKNRKTLQELQSAGVEVKLYPVGRAFNQVNHNKLAIVDKKAFLLGSRNWGRTFGNDDDFDIQFFCTGEGVKQAQAVFERDWQVSGGEGKRVRMNQNAPLAIIGNEPGDNDLTAEIQKEIKNAKESLLVSATWLSDKGIMQEINSAKERGVHVQVLLSNFPNNKNAYQFFKEKGVPVRVFSPPPTDRQRSSFHQKMLIADGNKVIMGSCDLSSQGLYLNREANAVADNKELAGFLTNQFQQDWEKLTSPDVKFLEREEKLKKKKDIKDKILYISEQMPAPIQKVGMLTAGLISLVSRKLAPQTLES